MRRLRFWRVLLPVLLLPFLVLLILQLQPKPPVHNAPGADTAGSGPRLESMNWVDFVGGKAAYRGDIGLVRQENDGKLRLEDIRRFVVERDDAPPLIIRADLGGIQGQPGERIVRLEGGVEAFEDGEGLRVFLPQLEVDQAAGEARSVGGVRLETPSYRGTAGSVVYGLEGQPTRLADLVLEREDGGRLEARRAVLYDGTRDMELEGAVRVARGSEYVEAERMHVWRRSGGGLRRLLARNEVAGALRLGDGEPVRFRGERLEVQWDARDRASALGLVGSAWLDRGDSTIEAASIDAARAEGDPERWRVEADGNVRARESGPQGRGTLHARFLQAEMTSDGLLLRATGVGAVEFEGPETRAEAEQAQWVPGASDGEVVLVAGERRRARLASGETRVTADRIVTDRNGAKLTAEGKVEATVLPASRSGAESANGGLFQADEPVHFVASRLAAERSGSGLTFSGSVRGWQGDRTLSADRVFVEQQQRILRAWGNVNTRIPRDERRGAVSQADYLQVSGDELDYAEARALAVYRGDARVRQAEGWLEAARVEISLGEGEGGLRQIRAFERIRFEYNAPADSTAAGRVSGTGDSVVYVPADRTVWLYGESTPATILRGGEGGAQGRVLRYNIESGTLNVESGGQDRVKIRTSGGPR